MQYINKELKNCNNKLKMLERTNKDNNKCKNINHIYCKKKENKSKNRLNQIKIKISMMQTNYRSK